MTILVYPNHPPQYLRQISLPEYAVFTKEWDLGERRISAQSIGAGTALTLGYEKVSHSTLAALIAFWGQTKGTWISFTLPGTIVNHPDAIKQAIALLKATTFWRFDEGLQMKTDYATLQRGLYSFDVKIKAVVS